MTGGAAQSLVSCRSPKPGTALDGAETAGLWATRPFGLVWSSRIDGATQPTPWARSNVAADRRKATGTLRPVDSDWRHESNRWRNSFSSFAEELLRGLGPSRWLDNHVLLPFANRLACQGYTDNAVVEGREFAQACWMAANRDNGQFSTICPRANPPIPNRRKEMHPPAHTWHTSPRIPDHPPAA